VKTRRDYKRETTRPPFQLELDNPVGEKTFVTFKDPNKIDTHSAFSLSRTPDPDVLARALLSDEDFHLWWAEWADAPVDETNALLEDVQEYYGANPGKPAR
jgi:hypothetical protein